MDSATPTPPRSAPAASPRLNVASMIGAAVLALSSWTLARTVEHDQRLAALAENRPAAVLEARLADLRDRLERLESQTSAILSRLPSPR